MAEDQQIDLAKVEGFTLGPLRIDPPTLQVTRGDKRETLEPRIMQVFVALARRRGEVVSREDLITQCWDGRSVGDDSINRCISRLRRLSEAEGGFGIETIPRVGYRLQENAEAAAESASPTMVPEPKPTRAGEAEANPGEAPARAFFGKLVRRRALVLAGAVLAMLASGMAFWLGRADPLSRVAVLPFDALDSSPEARPFGAAVADQIIGVLSENQVQAVARDAVASLRGPGRDDEARKLGADFILDGTVKKTPDGLRVIVHLDRASSHTTLWSGTFDQTGLDPAGLQSLVAARVVDEIKAAQVAAELKDDAAIAAFLKAKEYSREGGRSAALLRRDQMRIVVEHAPDFAPGHSGLAWSAALILQYSGTTNVAALRAEALREAERALKLDPKSGEAYLALAVLAPPSDFGEQERLFRKGLSVDPDEPTLNSSLAYFLGDVGRNSEALPLHERAVQLDPLSPRKNAGLAQAQAIIGNTAQARATLAQAIKLWPVNPNLWGVRVYIEILSDPPTARDLLKDAPRVAPTLEPDFFAAADAGLTAIEHNSPANRAIARGKIIAAFAARHLDNAVAIEFFARTGDIDGAYMVTEKAFSKVGTAERNYRPDASILFRPSTAALRRDARFLPLVEKLGLMRYWRAHTPPDFCRSEAVEVCRLLKTRAGG